MNLTAILLLSLCITASAKGFSQKITLNEKDAPLEKIFQEIKKQSGYSFVYRDEWMQQAKKVDLNLNNVSITEALNACFKNQPLTYALIEKTVVVKQKEKISNENDRAQIVILSTIEMDVTGKVIDPDGNPLKGASVKIKHSKQGTITDSNGEFILKDVDGNAILEISYVGYLTETVAVGNRVSIVVSLTVNNTPLEETIIKGYYSTTRKNNTGSVSKITSNDIGTQPVTNVLSALQARAPGLVITQTTGMPGGNFVVQIRGQNSLRNYSSNNGNAPLFVVDGVPYFTSPLTTSAAVSLYPQTHPVSAGANPLNNLNPVDIESVEILKDADATAIYGSRGANGVILITTKKGKTGEMKIDANIYVGAGKVTRRMELLNTQQYIEMRKEAYRNDGIATYPANAYDINGTWDQNHYTDWQKEFFGGTAHYTDAQLSMSGGNNFAQYRISGGYHKETTVFPGDFSNQRASVQFSLINTSPNKKFKSQVTINYGLTTTNLLQLDPTGAALTLPPNTPAMKDGNGNLLWTTGVNNIFSATKRPYNSKNNSLIGNTVLSYQLFPGLTLKANLGYNTTYLKETQKSPINSFNQTLNPASLSNQTQFGNGSVNSWILEPQIGYKKTFNKHAIELLSGLTLQNQTSEKLRQSAFGFPSEALMDNIGAVPAANVYSQFNNEDYKYTALFARAGYQFDAKYLVNLTGRRDGSSRFGPGRQFANFGSIGLAWVFSKEGSIQRAMPFLSFGKLRTSYGTTGSDQIGDYMFMDTYSSSGQYQGVTGVSQSRLFNPDFQWETNKKFEAALDLGFAGDKILLSAAYYRNRSSNQLVGYALPPTTGFTSIQYNLPATVQNTGLELEVSTQNIKNKNLTWTSSFNFTKPNNKLIEYPDLKSSSYAPIYVIGEPLTILRRYLFQGVDPSTGLYLVKDVDGNGIYNSADYAVNSFTGQKFFGGLYNELSYNNFNLNFLFQFVKQSGQNYLRNFLNAPGTMFNQPIEVLNRWQKPGDNSPIQRYSTNSSAVYGRYAISDAGITDASFIRLKNVSLSYNLASVIMRNLKIRATRIYVQGQNLLTITRYKGLDPESQGNALPPLRVLTAGIQISL